MLEDCYREIQRSRMHDVPILNHALQVQALGFEPWQQFRLGVLLTPWLMNIMLLPQDDSLVAVAPGEKQHIDLPSGNYEFVCGQDDSFGKYLSCSLFSPVFEFADHTTFEQTALAALDAIMQAENQEQLGHEDWPEPLPAAPENTAEPADRTAPSTEETTVSRRGFLRKLRGEKREQGAPMAEASAHD